MGRISGTLMLAVVFFLVVAMAHIVFSAGVEVNWKVQYNPSSGTDIGSSTCFKDGFVYSVGRTADEGDADTLGYSITIWKINASTGAIVSTLRIEAIDGVADDDSDIAASCSVVGNYLYVVGYSSALGSYTYVIEKIDLSTFTRVGEYYKNFATTTVGYAIETDGTYLYAGGYYYDSSISEQYMFIEKVDPSTMSIVATYTVDAESAFGCRSGSSSSHGGDSIYALHYDGMYLYAGGQYYCLGDWDGDSSVDDYDYRRAVIKLDTNLNQLAYNVIDFVSSFGGWQYEYVHSLTNDSQNLYALSSYYNITSKSRIEIIKLDKNLNVVSNVTILPSSSGVTYGSWIGQYNDYLIAIRRDYDGTHYHQALIIITSGDMSVDNTTILDNGAYDSYFEILGTQYIETTSNKLYLTGSDTKPGDYEVTMYSLNLTGFAKPKVTITSPLNTTYSYHNDNPIEFNFTVTSQVNSTFHVKYYIDGNLLYDNTSYQNGTEIYFTKDTSELGLGLHNFTVWANDSNGESSKTVWFTIDNQPPSITITNPQNTTYYNTNSITVNTTISDPDSSVYSCNYYLDGSFVKSGLSLNEVWSISSGFHTFAANCSDGLNWSYSEVNFTVINQVKCRLYDEITKLPLQGYCEVFNETYYDSVWVEDKLPTNGWNITCTKYSSFDYCDVVNSTNYVATRVRRYGIVNATQYSNGTFELSIGIYTKIDDICSQTTTSQIWTAESEVMLYYDDSEYVYLYPRSSQTTTLNCISKSYEIVVSGDYCYVYVDRVLNTSMTRRCTSPRIVAKSKIGVNSGYDGIIITYLNGLTTGGGSKTWDNVLGSKWLSGKSDILYAGQYHIIYPSRGLYSTNEIVDGKLYLLSSLQGVYSTVIAKDVGGSALKSAILSFYRIDANKATKLFECKTDDAGQCIVFVDPNVYYIVQYNGENRTVRFSSGQTYTIVFGTSGIYNPPKRPKTTCNANSTTVECHVSGDYVYGYRLVADWRHNYTTEQVCNVEQWLKNGTISCDLTPYNVTSGSIVATLYWNYDYDLTGQNWLVLNTEIFFIPETRYGDAGKLFALGLVMVAALTAVISPAIALVLIPAVVFLSIKIGLLPGSPTTWIAVLIVSGIILYRAIR